MRNKIRLYEYKSKNDDGTQNTTLLGKEWSDKVSPGYTIQTVIDETLPEFQITLSGTDKPQRFQAGWKFIMQEIYVNPQGNELVVATHHLVATDDFCQRVRMQNRTTFKHRITFSSASILAQKATCDNFAITYKLQDVDLDLPLSFNRDTTTSAGIHGNIRTPEALIFNPRG